MKKQVSTREIITLCERLVASNTKSGAPVKRCAPMRGGRKAFLTNVDLARLEFAKAAIR